MHANDWIVHMTTAGNLRPDARALLQRLVDASTSRPGTPFEYRPVHGYAFGWLLHPGFIDGTRLSSHQVISELEANRLIDFQQRGFPDRPSTFDLTGLATSILNANRDLRTLLSDPSATRNQENRHY